MDAFVGEIKLVPYSFAPQGWAFCHGQLMPISQNTALFMLLGTMYGGNGQSNFALPDLRGRSLIGKGQGFGLTPRIQGEKIGAESVALAEQEMPSHTHAIGVTPADANSVDPENQYLARITGLVGPPYASSANAQNPTMIEAAGGGQPHANMQPYLVMNYIICLQGIYPPRP